MLRVSAGLDPIHGGPPQSTAMSCLAAHRAGIETVVLTIDEGAAGRLAANVLRAAGVVVVQHPLLGGDSGISYRWTVSAALARDLKRWTSEVDVVHAHGAWTFTTLASLVMARLRGLPTVLTPHESMTNFDLAKSARVNRLVKETLRISYLHLFDTVVFASELERTESSRRRSRAYSIVLPHPVEFGVGAQTPPVREGSLRVGFLGRFDSKKRLDILLQALPEHAQLCVAGDGPVELARNYRHIAVAQGIQNRVEWLGFIGSTAKRDFLASLDVLVMPSAFEGFGIAAAEAISMGVPVLVSPDTGIAATVRRHGCGEVVESQPDPIRQSLQRVEFWRGDARAATTAAAIEFSPETHGEELRRLYDHLVASGRRSER